MLQIKRFFDGYPEGPSVRHRPSFQARMPPPAPAPTGPAPGDPTPAAAAQMRRRRETKPAPDRADQPNPTPAPTSPRTSIPSIRLPNSNATRNWGVFQLYDGTLRKLGGTREQALNPDWNIRAAHRPAVPIFPVSLPPGTEGWDRVAAVLDGPRIRRRRRRRRPWL
ncbi:hypothetical protein GCM10022420_049960 [Streptomyces iranensis]